MLRFFVALTEKDPEIMNCPKEEEKQFDKIHLRLTECFCSSKLSTMRVSLHNMNNFHISAQLLSEMLASHWGLNLSPSLWAQVLSLQPQIRVSSPCLGNSGN